MHVTSVLCSNDCGILPHICHMKLQKITNVFLIVNSIDSTTKIACDATHLKYVCSKIFRSCRKKRLSSQIHSSSSLFSKYFVDVVVFFVELVDASACAADALLASAVLSAELSLHSLLLLESISHFL